MKKYTIVCIDNNSGTEIDRNTLSFDKIHKAKTFCKNLSVYMGVLVVMVCDDGNRFTFSN